MKILVISNSPWDDSNSFGSTFSNFFQGFEKNDIASIYCSGGEPNTQSCGRFFRISEGALIRTIKNPKKEAGEEVFVSEKEQSAPTESRKAFLDFARKHRWIIFFWFRELLWRLGRWKGKKLDDFIEEFNPDVVVLPTYSYSYINKLALHIQKKWDLPMVSYVSDDEYTLKQFSLSPLYWLNRFYQRKWVKKGIENSKILYTISTVQKTDYEQCFSVPCKVLTKFSSFDEPPATKESYNKPLRIVYTGNIGGNRWKSLSLLAQALQEVNGCGEEATLEIYTATPTTKAMCKALNVQGCSEIKGKVSAAEVRRLQHEADLLVHVEAMDLKNRLLVRQSFSTKLVDYFKMARPILAIGPMAVASMAHLVDNRCALTCCTKEEVVEQIKSVLHDPKKLEQLSQSAYECGKAHHDKEKLQSMLIKDLEEICGSQQNESLTN